MERLGKCEKTATDIKSALQERDLFRDVGLSGPVSLTEALRMDMSCLSESPATIGTPATAWWWFVEDFYRPIGRNDMLKLMASEDEVDPMKDRCFRMPPLGSSEGRRTLTEWWEAFGHNAARKERRSGRLAEKKAFSPGHEIPTTLSNDWLDLPKEALRTQKNALQLCNDPSIVSKLDQVLNDLDIADKDDIQPPSEVHTFGHTFLTRYQVIHPLTQNIVSLEKDANQMNCEGEGKGRIDKHCHFSSHCLAIGPDDEIAAEVLKLQESLFDQIITNRTMARRLAKAALRNAKMDRKQALLKEQKENEIAKCMRIIDEHESKMKEKRASQKQNSPPEETPEVKPKDESISKNAGSGELEKLKSVPVTSPVRSPSRGLNPLDQAQIPAVEDASIETCDICGTSEGSSPLLKCAHCGIHVHRGCYEKSDSTNSNSKTAEWRCLPCRLYHEQQKGINLKPSGIKKGGALSVECKICRKRGGAYEQTPGSKKWIHTLCQLVIAEGSHSGYSFVKGKCIFCDKLKGLVVRCGHKNCDSLFHPVCAKAKGQLRIKHKKKRNDKGALYIELMTCGRCELNTTKKEIEEAVIIPRLEEDEDVDLVSMPVAKRKKKSGMKQESLKMMESELCVDGVNGEEDAVSRCTRSKSKRQKTEDYNEPKPQSKPLKKTNSSSTSQSKQQQQQQQQFKKRKEQHITASAGGKLTQKTHSQEINGSLSLPGLSDDKKMQRVTRSRK